MRVGLALDGGQEDLMAQLAEEVGLFGVLAGNDDPLAGMNAAVFASAHTSAVRIIVRVPLGCEHPVTVAEEIAVLDNINAGRTVVLADTAELSADAADEEVEVIRRSLSARFVQHRGKRFKVPAGIPTNTSAGTSISVTPKPTQVEVPIWMTGDSGNDVAARQGLPMLAQHLSDCDPDRLVQPALATVAGQMEADRQAASSWASAGATHLLLRLPADADAGPLLREVAQYIVPEVAMPDYLRITSEARAPLPWPRGVSGSDDAASEVGGIS